MNTLKLQRVGKNDWGYMAYKDENGRFYLDIDMRKGKNPETLYQCSPSDDMNGEPDSPVRTKFEIINPLTEKELKMQLFSFEYQMLSRLKEECEAFVGKTGNEQEDKWDCRYQNIEQIWGTTVEDHIDEMKRLWNKIPDGIKPEWCTAKDIDELEHKAKTVDKTKELLKKFDDLKKEYPDRIFLFRQGDFYEMYKEDAGKAVLIFGISLEDKMPPGEKTKIKITKLAIPKHELDTYLPKLVRAGERVAIYDPIEVPVQKKSEKESTTRSNNKDLHKAEIVSTGDNPTAGQIRSVLKDLNIDDIDLLPMELRVSYGKYESAWEEAMSMRSSGLCHPDDIQHQVDVMNKYYKEFRDRVQKYFGPDKAKDISNTDEKKTIPLSKRKKKEKTWKRKQKGKKI